MTLAFGGNGYLFAPGAVHRWLVLHDYDASIPNGRTFRTTVAVNSHVTVRNTSSQARTVTGATVTGALKTVDNVGTLTVSLGSGNPAAGNQGKAAQDVVVMQLKLEASAAETLIVDSLVFTASGTINDVTDISAVKLYRDVDANGALSLIVDTQIDSSRSYNADNGTVTFVSAVSETLLAGATERWFLVYDLANSASAGETFKASVADNGDIAVLGTNGAVDDPHTANTQGAPVVSNTMTISSTGQITLSAGASNPTDGNVDSTALNVPMVQFNLAASSVEDIEVLGVGVRHTGSANAKTDIANGSVEIYRDVNGNGAFDSGTDSYYGNASLFEGYSLDFDGVNGEEDYVGADGAQTNFLYNKSAATWEAWVYQTNNSGIRMVMSKVQQRLAISNGQIQFYGRTNDLANRTGDWRVLGTATVPLNQWAHVAVVYDGSYVRAYINGVKTTTVDTPATGALINDTYNFRVGTYYNGTGYEFAGKIDEVRISDIARYTSNFTPPKADFYSDENTMLLWHMDEGTGTTVTGYSSNGIDGTLGSAASNNDPAWSGAGGAHATNVANVNVNNRTIPAGTSQNWLVIYDLGGTDTASIGETFTSWIDMERVVAIGADSRDYVTVVGDNVAGGAKTVSATGDITLSAGPNNPTAGSVGPGTQNVPMLQMQLTASSAETLLIGKFKIKASGTADDATAVDSVGLVADLNGNGIYDAGVDSFITHAGATIKRELTTNDSTVTFTFSPAYELPKNTSENWLVVYDINSGVANGKTFQTRFVLASYISVTGKLSGETIVPSLGSEIAGGLKTLSNIGTLTIAAGENTPTAGNVGAGTANVPLMQLELTASNAETLRVDSISVKMTGTAKHDSVLTAVKLYRDVNDNGLFDSATDVAIAATATITDAAYDSAFSVRFAINTSDSLIAPTETVNWLVLASIASDAPNGATLGAKLVLNDSVWCVGAESSSDANVLGAPITSALKTISNVGSLTLAAGPQNPAPSNVSNDAADLAMLQVRFTTSSPEQVRISSFRLTAGGSANDTVDIKSNGIRVYRDVNSNGVYDSGSDVLVAQGTEYTADNGYIIFSGVNHVIPAGSTEDWLVVYDLDSTATNGETFTVTMSNSMITATGVSSGQSITVGGNTVSGGTKTVSSEGSLTIALGANTPAASTVSPGETNVAVMQVQLQASSAETLYVSSIKFKASGTGDDTLHVTNVALWDDLDNNGILNTGIDTTIVASGAYTTNDGTVTFTIGGQGYRFSPSGAHRWLLAQDFGSGIPNGKTFRAAVALNSYVVAKNGSAATRTVTGAPFTSNTMTVSNIGVLTVSLGTNNPASANVGLEATNVAVMQLKLAASAAETLIVNSITFTGSGTLDESADITEVRLYRDVNSNGSLDLATDEQLGNAGDVLHGQRDDSVRHGGERDASREHDGELARRLRHGEFAERRRDIPRGRGRAHGHRRGRQDQRHPCRERQRPAGDRQLHDDQRYRRAGDRRRNRQSGCVEHRG